MMIWMVICYHGQYIVWLLNGSGMSIDFERKSACAFPMNAPIYDHGKRAGSGWFHIMARRKFDLIFEPIDVVAGYPCRGTLRWL